MVYKALYNPGSHYISNHIITFPNLPPPLVICFTPVILAFLLLLCYFEIWQPLPCFKTFVLAIPSTWNALEDAS